MQTLFGASVKKDGEKYFIKQSFITPEKEVSEYEFYEFIKNTDHVLRVDEKKPEQTVLLDLREIAIHNVKNDRSEFGERVNVTITEESQERQPNNTINVRVKLGVTKEKSGDFLFDVTFAEEGWSGPMAKPERNTNFPEMYRAFTQLALNGALAKQEEVNAIK